MNYRNQIEKTAVEYTKKQLAKKWGVSVDEISNKDLDYAEKEHNKKVAKGGAGIVGGAVGANVINKARQEGMLDGVVRRYHNTKKDNVSGIKEHGILSNKAMDPDNLTSMAAGIGKEEQAGKTYMAKKKGVADGIGMRRDQIDNGRLMPDLFGAKKTQETLKVNIPVKDYKGMHKVDNPELMGAKNAKEFQKILQKKVDGNIMYMGQKIPMNVARSGFNQLGPQTDVIQGDIASKYVKGGKGYEKQTLKGIGRFIKENPKHFAKGLGHVGLGAIPIAIGGKLLADSFKKTKNPHHKEANEIIEECFEKIAGK